MNLVYVIAGILWLLVIWLYIDIAKHKEQR
jgi:uncharacterized membrane protein